MPKVKSGTYGHDINEHSREVGRTLITRQEIPSLSRIQKELFIDRYSKYKEAARLVALVDELGLDAKYYDNNYQATANVYYPGESDPLRLDTAYTFHMQLDGKNPLLMNMQFDKGIEYLRGIVRDRRIGEEMDFVDSLNHL